MLSSTSSFAAVRSSILALVFGLAACGASDSDGLFGPSAGSGAGGAGGAGAASSGSGGVSGGDENGGTLSGGSAGDSAGSSDGGTVGATGGSANGGSDAGASGGGASGGDGAGGSTAGIAGTGGSGGGAPSCTPSEETCDGLDNDCDGQADEGKACGMGCEGFAIGEHGYMYCSMANTLTAATELCQAESMRLAWIETEAENAALVQALAPLVDPDTDLLGPDPGVRIGASDAEEEGEWFWIDGPPFWDGDEDGEPVDAAFASWSPGRPNNGTGDVVQENCAVLIVHDGQDGVAGAWNDVRCTQVQPFVCEAP